jgi:hypothetical protein
MGGGGGGVDQRKFGKEWPQITAGYTGQENQLQSFLSGTGQTPQLLSRAGSLAGYWNQNPQLNALLEPVQSWGGAFTPESVGKLTSGLSAWSGANTPAAIGGLTSGITDWSSSFSPSAVGELTKPFESALSGTIDPILASGGDPTKAEKRSVAQSLLPYFSGQGTGRSTTALSSLALSEDAARRQRFEEALGEAQTATGQIQGLRGAGLAGREAISSGVESLRTQGQSNQSKLAQIIQGLRGSGLSGASSVSGTTQGLETGGINQLLGTAQAQSNVFSQLTNPILSYLSNLFGENLQAQSQAQLAGGNKSSGIAGGGISAIGSIIGAVLPLIAGSDERIKTKIRSTGIRSPSGIELKTYEFKTRPGVAFLGPMAQDVEKKKKSAVLRDPVTGLKYVDFSQIDAPMIQLPSMMKAA